jgi:hypothetical protein
VLAFKEAALRAAVYEATILLGLVGTEEHARGQW